MGNNNYLKELRLWLCASLKNSDAQLICECHDDNIIQELEQLKEQLLMLVDKVNNLQQQIIILKNKNKYNNGGNDEQQGDKH